MSGHKALGGLQFPLNPEYPTSLKNETAQTRHEPTKNLQDLSKRRALPSVE